MLSECPYRPDGLVPEGNALDHCLVAVLKLVTNSKPIKALNIVLEWQTYKY